MHINIPDLATSTKEIILKNLERINKKISKVNNFIVLNINLENIDIKDIILVEIWGDTGYYYQGKISDNKGIFPSFALKLKEDTQLFIKLIIINDSDKPLNYINFITIPKKYQNDEDIDIEADV